MAASSHRLVLVGCAAFIRILSLINKKTHAMPTHKVSDTLIAICIVPKRVRDGRRAKRALPGPRRIIASMRSTISSEMSTSTVRRSSRTRNFLRARSAGAAPSFATLRKLVDYRPFEIAEKALIENIVALDRLSGSRPRASTNATEVTAGAH